MSVVIDASAVLAIIFDEPGADIALASARNSRLSAVNLDEVLHKIARRDVDTAESARQLARLEIQVVPFTAGDAVRTASMHPMFKGRSISFADRVCLDLAMTLGATLVTADREWVRLGLDLDIRLIR